MEKVMNFINCHLNFKVWKVTLITIAVFLLIFPALKYMPQKYGYENGLIENIQMIVLWIMVFLCAKAKNYKSLFRYIIFVLILLILREVNLGRTLFFHIPGTENSYLPWREIYYHGIPMGKVVHGTYGIMIAIVSIMFFVKKLYIDAWNLISKTRLPFWQLFFAFLGMFMGAIAEKATNNNFIFEEGFELLFYVAIMGIVYLYSRHKDYEINE